MKKELLRKEDLHYQLEPEILSQLKSYEDFLSYYIQLSQDIDSVAWKKADLIMKMQEVLGESSIKELSKDIKVPEGTVINYLRTARAFPADKRDTHVSFTLHMQASYADEYDDQQKRFLTDNRFGWLNKAIDDNLSTRELKGQIQSKKVENTMGELLTKCTHCGKNNGEVIEYIFYAPSQRRKAVKIKLHEACYLSILNFIYDRK